MVRKRAHPLMSEGARLERKAIRTRLRRTLKAVIDSVAREVLSRELAWVLARERRYSQRPGGLGR